MTPVLTFVIPVRNDADRLKRCLHTILDDAGSVPIEIVVTDNGSTDDSPAVALTAGAEVLRLPDRPVSQLRNIGAKQAHAPLVAFVDADHALAVGWIEAALGSFSDAAVSAVGTEYSAPPETTWVQRLYDAFRSHPPGTTLVHWLPSGNLVVRKASFERVGGFDETLESCEDVDFCRRLREAGGKLMSNDALRSVHFGDPRTLSNLFFSELWRGRDNLRVSLRERLTWRSAPSLVIPLLNVLNLAIAILGLATAPFGGWVLIAAAAAAFAALTGLRVFALLSRLAEPTALDVPRAWIVAATYDLARALALIVRANHRVRRRG